MRSTLEDVQAQAMQLTPAERAELADRLWASVVSQAELDAAWTAEIERRVAQLESGEAETVAHEEVAARLRARFG